MILLTNDVIPQEHHLLFCSDPQLVDELAIRHHTRRWNTQAADSQPTAKKHDPRSHRAIQHYGNPS